MSPEEVARHAQMLANRVRKNQRRLGRSFAREGIDAYRLYDWDIPEVRATVDRCADHLVVAEYARTQTDAAEDYVGDLARAVGEALDVPESNLHVRRRRTGKQRGHSPGARRGVRVEVQERALRFVVNLSDYLDTGLFTDHRETRRMVSEWSSGAAVLNLFAYTGSFTCWAAHGGARSTVTVDASGTYLEWAQENMALNGLSSRAHRFVEADVGRFLSAERHRFDLIVVDPPSFSTRFGEGDFDIDRDHPALLERLRPLLTEGGRVLFSTNHQRFTPRLEELPYDSVEEITAATATPDHRNPEVHRAFVLKA